MEIEEAALLCRVLGDPNRMRIVMSLLGKELCACNLLEQFNISQPTLSHHMQVLCDCGLVDARKEGKWMHYSLNREKLIQLQQFIEALCSGDAEAEIGTSFTTLFPSC